MADNEASLPLTRARPGPARNLSQLPRTILVVEEDRLLAAELLTALDAQGYVVEHVTTGTEALETLVAADFDVLVLDMSLPDIDGFEMLSRLDPMRKCAVLAISTYDRVEERVRGLDLGADDYLVKPFAVEEFEARIRAILRRGQAQRDSRIEVAALAVDLVGKRAWIDGSSVDLTAREWSVLIQLLLRIGQVVSKAQILLMLGGDQQPLSDNAVEVYVSRLRVKLADAGINIRTLRGFGYMIEEPR